MEQRINIAELLKDCPKGMELYSPLCGDCKLYDVNDYNIRIEASNKDTLICLYHDGRYCANGEIMLFPKGKTTWEGFQRPFKDGDILTSELDGCKGNPFIFKQINSFGNAECYCAINCFGELIFDSDNWTSIKGCKLATPKDKEKLFDVINKKGYKWNAETKTLEKLVEPKFKVGIGLRKKIPMKTLF